MPILDTFSGLLFWAILYILLACCVSCNGIVVLW